MRVILCSSFNELHTVLVVLKLNKRFLSKANFFLVELHMALLERREKFITLIIDVVSYKYGKLDNWTFLFHSLIHETNFIEKGSNLLIFL